MRVIVVGAGGQLGAAVTSLFGADADVLALARRDVDITDAAQVRALADRRPDVLINCAAFNAVDRAETQPDAARAVNVDAVRRLAEAANAADATFVHFSSDFVFDGDADAPYDEDDAVNPISEYGRSKADGERAASVARRAIVLRLASVFGGRRGEGCAGSTTIDRIVDATAAGGEVVAFADRTVSPSYTHDVARAVHHLVRRGSTGLFHCVNSGWTTWADLARQVAALLEVPARVRAVSMREVTMTARRPLHCALSNARLAAAGVGMPSWRDALARHIAATRVDAITGAIGAGSRR
jgi:dTDP-4-dehydrorhamnose reductase